MLGESHADADEYAIAKGRDQMRKHCGPQQIIVSRLFGSDLITFTFLCVVFTFYLVCCFSKYSSVLDKDSCELKVLV